jgi:hypothetical protein
MEASPDLGPIEVTFVSCRRVVPDPTFLAECLQSAYDEMFARLAPVPAATAVR